MRNGLSKIWKISFYRFIDNKTLMILREADGKVVKIWRKAFETGISRVPDIPGLKVTAEVRATIERRED